ncbi:MAG TPA: hypothetical protein VF519_06785 [Mycobacteriales bacterium]
MWSRLKWWLLEYLRHPSTREGWPPYTDEYDELIPDLPLPGLLRWRDRERDQLALYAVWRARLDKIVAYEREQADRRVREAEARVARAEARAAAAAGAGASST